MLGEYAEPQSTEEIYQRYRQITVRVRKPVNCVEDDGIDLKRSPKGFKPLKPLPKPKEVFNHLQEQNAHVAAFRAEAHRRMVLSRYRCVHNTFGKTPIPEIWKQVSAYTGISIGDMKSDQRNKPVVEARRMVAARLYTEWNFSLPKIGQLMDRDHTSILNLLRKAGVYREMGGNRKQA